MGRRPATIRNPQVIPREQTRLAGRPWRATRGQANAIVLPRVAAVLGVLLILVSASGLNGQSGVMHSVARLPQPQNHPISAAVRARVTSNFANLPLSFEENRGQTDSRVKFLSRGPGYTLFLTEKEAVFALPPRPTSASGSARQPAALRLSFDHANSRVQIGGQVELPGKTNYFPSGDRNTWHTGIRNYSSVAYREIYPGVDAVFHGSPRRLEFDFDLAPGADPSKIALDFTGGRALRLDQNGDVILGVGSRDGEVMLGRPIVYQEIAGQRREIAGRFVLRGAHSIGFQLGEYDRSHPLTIDPTLTYSTYLGTDTGEVYGSTVAVDSSGSAYVLGYTLSSTFPGPGSPITVPQGDALFLSKFTPDGSALVYTSLFPQAATSTSEIDASSVAVDANESAYIAVATYENMATTGAYSNPYTSGSNLTVIKLSSDGSEMVYAAQIGPVVSSGIAIAVDPLGNAYTAATTGSTSATHFPTTTGAFQTAFTCHQSGCTDATVSKLSADGSTLVYSTFLGGSYSNYGSNIAVDSQGDAYVAGVTNSGDFTVTSNAVQTYCLLAVSYPDCGSENAFLTELNPSGSGLLYSTFLGSGVETEASGAPAIAIDSAGAIYMTGTTISNVFASALSSTSGPTNFGPTEQCGTSSAGYCAILPDGGTNEIAFAAKFAAGGSQLLYLGFLGGYNAAPPSGTANGTTIGYSVGADPSGRILLAGATSSSFFPVTADALQSSCQCDVSGGLGEDATFTIIDPTQSGAASVLYATYFGGPQLSGGAGVEGGTGIAVDSTGNAYLAGFVEQGTIPTTAGSLQPTCPLLDGISCTSAFLAKFTTGLSEGSATIAAVSGGGQSAVIGQTFVNPLVVQVTDANSNPISGTTVTFSAPSSGASATLSSTIATTDSNGNASVTATANGLASGTAYQVSATVAGASTPAAFALTNTQAATSLVVTPSGTSLVYGQMVAVNASISPSSVAGSAPSGYVAFWDGTTVLTLTSSVANAAASYTVAVPTVGSHTYAAQYLGDTNFAGSTLTSAATAVAVNKASVTLSGPATQPVSMQSGSGGSFTVTIAGQYSGSGIAAPTGSLSYSVSGNAFGPGSSPLANGTATISVPATVAPGTYTVSVSYGGDQNYNSNSINIQLIVYQPLTITTAALPAGIVGTAYPVGLASGFQLNATGGSGSYTWSLFTGSTLPAYLTLSSAGAISGVPITSEAPTNVTVQVTDSAGDLALKQYTFVIYLPILISPTSLPAGIAGTAYSQTLSAAGGSGTGYTWSFASGASSLSAIGLSLSSAGLISGTPSAGSATFSVQVTDSLGFAATQSYVLTVNPAAYDPETIKVSDTDVVNAFTLAAPISVAAPVAFFSTGGPLTFGGQSGNQQTIAVSNIGQVSMTLDSASISTGAAFTSSALQCFNGATTTSSSVTLPTSGFCTLTITYTGSSPATDTGSLTFTDNAALSNLPTTASGSNYTQSITVYGECPTGSTCPATTPPPPPATVSVSDYETITVTDTPVVSVQAATNLALSGQVHITYGQTETLTATVTSNGSETPAGTVTFTSSGGAVLATVNLNSSGVATYTSSTLPAGLDIITAVYNGNSQFTSSAPTEYPIVVVAAGTTTLLTESSTPPTAGYGTTFTATVASVTSGTPTGTITFYDGSNAMGTGTLNTGVASYTTNALPGGSDSITAVYGGNADYFGSTSNALTPLVADFGMTFSSPSGSLSPGQSATFTMTVTPTNGSYNEPVTFSVSGLPAGATVAFNPASVTPGSSPTTASVTITAPPLNAKIGPGPFFRNIAPTALAVILLPFAVFSRKRRRRRALLLIAGSAIALASVAGLVGCGGGSGSSPQPPQTYTVTVTGSSGAVQHSTTITLTVE